MTINPRDYDLDELRKMARQPGEGLDEDRDPAEITVETDEDVLAGESFRSGLHRELLPFLDDDLEKPYLSSLPETYAAEFVVFEWLEFLLMHSGHRGAEGALAYYESVDWITEEVRDGLSEYLRGIDDAGAGDGSELDVDDHMLSLVYVAKLQSMT
ncbi:FlaD/FlaE family flagellar protein [Halomicrobium salinisoli]|uniref:FlaD/FlaE family flagellar protein n=1 Tax=Halomicrobium salinisoli TaxID=2878391 RepID=UPI001CF01E5D|nr:FlaD/FlaE family flagellar protein [Halomicrobium salinisoli]